MTTSASATTARLLGTTDECTDCELCGRTDLKRTVVIEFPSGDIVRAGSDCASRALGWTESTVRTRARTADYIAYQAALDAHERQVRALNDSWEARYRSWLMEHYGSDNDGLQGPLVSRPRERLALRDSYRDATGDRLNLPECPTKPAHLRR